MTQGNEDIKYYEVKKNQAANWPGLCFPIAVASQFEGRLGRGWAVQTYPHRPGASILKRHVSWDALLTGGEFPIHLQLCTSPGCGKGFWSLKDFTTKSQEPDHRSQRPFAMFPRVLRGLNRTPGFLPQCLGSQRGSR